MAEETYGRAGQYVETTRQVLEFLNAILAKSSKLQVIAAQNLSLPPHASLVRTRGELHTVCFSEFHSASFPLKGVAAPFIPVPQSSRIIASPRPLRGAL